MNSKEEIVLGYLDQCDNVYDQDEEFPSFANGLPAFMFEETNLDEIKCTLCEQTMKFLIQIYAPLNYQHSKYRVMYIFTCMNDLCINNQKSVRVFRMQSDKPPTLFISTNPLYQLSKSKPMIVNTEIINYKENNQSYQEALQLLPIKMEDDDDSAQMEGQNFEKEEKIYQQYLKNQLDDGMDNDKEDLNDLDKKIKNKADSSFLIYQHFLTEFPNHVLRYSFDQKTQPLWFSDQNQTLPPEKCQFCGRQKIFEFQINNSILTLFKELYNMDWGILIIQSCPYSCATKHLLTEESIYIQYDYQDQTGIKVDQAVNLALNQNDKKKQKKNNNKQQQQQQQQQQQIEEINSDGSDDW